MVGDDFGAPKRVSVRSQDSKCPLVEVMSMSSFDDQDVPSWPRASSRDRPLPCSISVPNLL